MNSSNSLRHLPKETSEAILAKQWKAYELARAGKVEEGESYLLETWTTLPDPKYDWSDSMTVTTAIVEYYLTFERIPDAITWLSEVFKTRKFEYQTHLDVLAGRVFYEAGDLSKAMHYWGKAYEIGGERAFADQDRKFLKIYKNHTSDKR